jgi:hypothetical protein
MLAASGARVFASPFAKKLASEKGIELAAVRGTGPHNRIIAADVEEYVPGEIASMCNAPVCAASAYTASDPSVMLILNTWYVPAAASIAAPVAATSAAVGTTEFTDMETSTIRKVRPDSSLARCTPMGATTPSQLILERDVLRICADYCPQASRVQADNPALLFVNRLRNGCPDEVSILHLPAPTYAHSYLLNHSGQVLNLSLLRC